MTVRGGGDDTSLPTREVRGADPLVLGHNSVATGVETGAVAGAGAGAYSFSVNRVQNGLRVDF